MPRRVVINRGFRSSGFTGARRKSEWNSSVAPSGVTSLASGTSIFNTANVALTPLTVVRIRGYLYVQSDQVAAREEAFGAFGLTVVNTVAATLGITAMPAPLTNMDESGSWALWVPWACSKSAGDGDASNYSMDFDSKAQRKLETDDQLVGVIQNAASGFGVEFEVFYRVLVLLP